MNLIQQSYQRLFPNRDFNYQTKLEYNRRLSPFNANIMLYGKLLTVKMNLQWKNVDEEIKIGLIQHLLTRIFKSKRKTVNIDFYHNFLKNIPDITPKTKSDPHLEKSFLRINEQFFFNQMEQPNLTWGRKSLRKLAHYNLQSDTVVVSTIFKNAPLEQLDYIMYHELLHKKHKFEQKGTKSCYHTKAFKEDEAKFPKLKMIEKEISCLVRSQKKPTYKKKGLLNFFLR